MSQENFWILLSKKIAGEANEQEIAELAELMQQHPEWQYAAQNLADIWKSHEKEDNSTEEDAYLLHIQRMNEQGVGFNDNILYTYQLNNQTRSHFNRWKKWYYGAAIAASIVIAVLLFPSLFNREKSVAVASKEVNEVVTNPGSRTKVVLPDGSLVWLNAGSRIEYNKDFGKVSRDVKLSGEAFFDVKRDNKKPFYIHTPVLAIKVLGTAFNVKAYPDDPTTETSLIRGSIEVSIKSRPMDKIILAPNEKLVVENKEAMAYKENSVVEKRESVVAINEIKPNRKDSTINEIQWVENRLVFDDEPLEEIVVKMERWYNVNIEITDPSLNQLRITGSFVNENIDQAMEGLSVTTGKFTFKRTANTIFIHP